MLSDDQLDLARRLAAHPRFHPKRGSWGQPAHAGATLAEACAQALLAEWAREVANG